MRLVAAALFSPFSFVIVSIKSGMSSIWGGRAGMLVAEAVEDLLLSGSRASSAAPAPEELFSEGESAEAAASLPAASPLADFFLRKDTLKNH